MAREKFKQTLNFDDLNVKHKFQAFAGTLRKRWRVSLEPDGNKRSNAANSYYWAAVATPFYEFLRQQDAEITNVEQAHELIKEKFLRISVINPGTGELLGYRTRSTTELTTEEFHDFIERVRAWLLDMFQVTTLDPEERFAEVQHA